MNNEHIKGAANKAKGAVKDSIGKATDNDRLRAEGQFDKVKGDAQKVAGDVKDAIRKSTQ